MTIYHSYTKSIVFLLLLLLSCSEIKAEENFKIENFEELQQKLNERLVIHNVNCGPICKSLKTIANGFKKEYSANEKTKMLKLLDTALKTIDNKSLDDRKMVEEIKSQFLRVKQKEAQKQQQKDQGNNDTLKAIKDLENSNSYYMLLAIIAVFLAAFGLLQMVKFREKLVEQKIKNREQYKEISLLNEKFFKKVENKKEDVQIPKLPIQTQMTTSFDLETTLTKKDEIRENPIIAAKLNLTEFYLSTPQTDGSFNDGNKTATYIPTSSMYKFSLLSNEKAKFEFVNDTSSLQDALNYPDTYLLPVCKSVNARNIQSCKITTTEHGIAELRDGKWKVSKKAVIRYD